jgi:hypothetical protein
MGDRPHPRVLAQETAMRMEPEAFLDLLAQDQPSVAVDARDGVATVGADDSLGDMWVAFHPKAGVFMGYHGDVQLWSNLSPAVVGRVTCFAEAHIAVDMLSKALDLYELDSSLLEVVQVVDGTWDSLLAVGLPVASQKFDFDAFTRITHPSVAVQQ